MRIDLEDLTMITDRDAIAYAIDVLTAVRDYVEPDSRADDETDEPSILVSIATDGDELAYQTGDTQFMGACYGLPAWGQAVVYADEPDDEIESAAVALVDEMMGDLYA